MLVCGIVQIVLTNAQTNLVTKTYLYLRENYLSCENIRKELKYTHPNCYNVLMYDHRNLSKS